MQALVDSLFIQVHKAKGCDKDGYNPFGLRVEMLLGVLKEIHSKKACNYVLSKMILLKDIEMKLNVIKKAHRATR